jgi:hypothetical protein
LLLVAVLTGGFTYVLWSLVYAELPKLPRSAALTLFAIAVAELLYAPSVRARLAGRPRTKPIMPIAVARTAALAKASSLMGAVSTGFWGALLVYVTTHRFRTSNDDTVTAGLATGAAALLIVAALLLERACRAPKPPEEPPPAEPGP